MRRKRVLKRCRVCGRGIDHKYRGWYDRYVPEVCSGQCLEILLTTPVHNRVDLAEAKPCEHSMDELRSGFEYETRDFLIRNNIPFKYEPFIFPIMNRREATYDIYTPDFYLYASGLFIEVKGEWSTIYKRKFREFVEQYNPTIYVIDQEALKLTRRANYKGG